MMQLRLAQSGAARSIQRLTGRVLDGRRGSIRMPLPLLALLAAACCLAPWAQAQRARSGAEKRQLAARYYDQAVELQKRFEQIPLEDRDQGEYERLIEAFRRVYWTDPSYGNDTVCLMAIGALYREMGQRWESQPAFESAVETYEFLIREYPGSKFRREAAQAIAEIQAAAAARAKAAEDASKSQGRDRREETTVAAEPSPAPTAGRPGDLALVSGVRHWVTPDYTRVVIDVGNDVKYGVGRVGNPPRVYVDLMGTRPVPEINNQTFPVENGLLTGVKTGRHTPDVTRVVLYVGDLTEYSVFELPNPYRVVVDIRDRDNAEAPAAELVSRATAPEPKVTAQPKAPAETVVEKPPAPPAVAVEIEESEEIEPVQEAEPVEVAAVAAGPVFDRVEAAQPNRDGTRSLTRALGLKIGKIMIDPGHGGSDTGTIGPSGYQEKDLVLDVAKRLGKLIEQELGSEVVFTRTDDSFVPLETRTAVANQQQADLFLSIHANSSRSPRTRGVETYYLNFTTDADALEVAARENAISQERISQLQGLVEKIALAEKVDESKEFAALVQAKVWKTQAVQNPKVADRGVKKAPFVVLIGANMPSVLSEIAFLSNPAEEKLLKTAGHRQKIAEALYEGILGYVETLSVVKLAER